MIYTRYGTTLTIEAYFGHHKPKGSNATARLVRGRREDGSERYYFAEHLKADDGPSEIDIALAKAEHVKINPVPLKIAIEQAS